MSRGPVSILPLLAIGLTISVIFMLIFRAWDGWKVWKEWEKHDDEDSR